LCRTRTRGHSRSGSSSFARFQDLRVGSENAGVGSSILPPGPPLFSPDHKQNPRSRRGDRPLSVPTQRCDGSGWLVIVFDPGLPPRFAVRPGLASARLESYCTWPAPAGLAGTLARPTITRGRPRQSQSLGKSVASARSLGWQSHDSTIPRRNASCPGRMPLQSAVIELPWSVRRFPARHKSSR
jgi:hypothetical protein